MPKKCHCKPFCAHDDHGSGIDPMHDADRQRMKPQPIPSI